MKTCEDVWPMKVKLGIWKKRSLTTTFTTCIQCWAVRDCPNSKAVIAQSKGSCENMELQYHPALSPWLIVEGIKVTIRSGSHGMGSGSDNYISGATLIR